MLKYYLKLFIKKVYKIEEIVFNIKWRVLKICKLFYYFEKYKWRVGRKKEDLIFYLNM